VGRIGGLGGGGAGAALQWSPEKEDSANAGLRMARMLHWFWFVRSHITEGRGCLARLHRNASFTPESKFEVKLVLKQILNVDRLLQNDVDKPATFGSTVASRAPPPHEWLPLPDNALFLSQFAPE
jgi:hypothetical protein